MWGEPELTFTYSCMALQPAPALRKETFSVMRQSFTLALWKQWNRERRNWQEESQRQGQTSSSNSGAKASLPTKQT